MAFFVILSSPRRRGSRFLFTNRQSLITAPTGLCASAFGVIWTRKVWNLSRVFGGFLDFWVEKGVDRGRALIYCEFLRICLLIIAGRKGQKLDYRPRTALGTGQAEGGPLEK